MWLVSFSGGRSKKLYGNTMGSIIRKTNDILELHFQHPEGKSAKVQVLRLSELRKRELPFSIYDAARHDCHTIHFVTQGRGFHWADFERIKLGRGDVLYVRPGQVHAFDKPSRHEALFLLFQDEALRNPDSLRQIDPVRLNAIRPKPTDFDLLVELVASLESVAGYHPSFDVHQLTPWILGAISTAIGRISQALQAQQRPSSQNYLEMVHDFERVLDKHFACHRTINWYARNLCVTVRSLSRACKTVRNRTPKQLVNARVSVEAKRYLVLTDDSVEQVARRVGFSESTNFVKFFRRTVGQSPAEFRRKQSVT